MRDLKQLAKGLFFKVLGKDPEAVVVTFLTGDSRRTAAMAEEVKALIPGRRQFIVDTPASVWELRRRFRSLRIGMAAVLFDGDSAFRRLRWAAFLLAPRKILAFNSRGERHHLQLRTAIASLLFLRGTPLDRIYLRPWWLCPWKRDRTTIPTDYQILNGRPLTSSRPRVAVLSPYFPYPLSHGGAVRVFNLLREASREFDIFLFAFKESSTPEDCGPVLEFCSQVTLVPKPRYREPRWSSLVPPEVGEYRSHLMTSLLEKARIEHGIQLVQVEYTQLGTYQGDVLVEHDVTFDLYSQVNARAKTLSSWWDLWRWKSFEKRTVRRFQRVVVMSGKDALMLPGTNTAVIANGVDLDRFRPEPERDGQRLLFIGSFRHFPNVVAFRFLIEDIWPLISRQIPDASLTVVSGPDAMLHWRNYAGSETPPAVDRMQLLEFVADVRPLYVETNLVLVPTLVSAGTNVKVLEAMAMERAVVSTPSGCGGLELEHGRSVWVGDDAATFAEGIVRLISDSSLRKQIAREARMVAEQQFDWRSLGRQQRLLWHQLLGNEVTIREARAEDAERLGEIQYQSPEGSHWPAASYLAYDCRVASVGGQIAAFAVFRQTSDDEHEVLNLAVAPEFRRRGIATALLKSAMGGAGTHLFLEVRESNAAARKLYNKLGFREIGVRRSYYSDPDESAIVMRF